MERSVHDTLCGEVSAGDPPGGTEGRSCGDSIVRVSGELCIDDMIKLAPKKSEEGSNGDTVARGEL